MIYNWTPFTEEGELKIDFEELTTKEAKKVSPDDWKPDSDREYFTTSVTNKQLVDQDGRYRHPSKDDIFVFGEETYGLDHILESSRKGPRWDFKILVHKLKKTTYAVPKSFGIEFNK